jgi:4-amino-4-deoxy-L-arabinose transferase-like glycosyltransferase
MLLGFFMAIFGKEFWVCQLANIVVNTVFIFPTYCLAKILFNKKIALMTIIFLQMIVFVEISLYIIAKMVVAYFLLTMLYLFITKKGSEFAFGLLAGLGYLIHQLSLIFAVSIFLPYFIENLRKRDTKKIISIVKIAIIFLLVISPWFAINFIKYGTISTSDYNNFPFYTNSYHPYGEGRPFSQILENFKKTSLSEIISARVINFVGVTTPAILILKIVSKFTPIIVSTYKVTNFAMDVAWHKYYLESLPGNITILIYIFSIIGFFKMYKYNKTIFYFILIPLIFFVLYYGWVVICIVKSGLPPATILLVMIGFWEVSKRKNAGKWIKLIFVLAVIEFIIFWIAYSQDIAFAEEIARTGGKNLSTEPLNKPTPIEEYEKLFSAYKLFSTKN